MRQQTMANKAVCVKLFAGCPITSEMRMHLNASLAWQQESSASAMHLRTQRFREREYLGLLIEMEQPTQRDLEVLKQRIHACLRHYCPGFNPELLPFFVFPQVLLS